MRQVQDLVNHLPTGWKGRSISVDGHLFPIDSIAGWAPPPTWKCHPTKTRNPYSRWMGEVICFVDRRLGGRVEWETQDHEGAVLNRGFANTMTAAIEAAEKSAANS